MDALIFFTFLTIAILIIVIIFLTKDYLRIKRTNKKFRKIYKPIINLDAAIRKRKSILKRIKTDSDALANKYANARTIYEKLNKEIRLYEDDLELMEFGVYKPHFDFDTSEKYKTRLVNIVDKQKKMIREENAAVCYTKWSVGESQKKGEMMTKRAIKLTLRAFNGECDSLIAKVKWNNAEQTEKRIVKAFDTINKLNKSNDIHIMDEYLNLKLDEMRLTHELAQKKYEEKEEQRRIRAQMREEEKAQRELEKARKEAEEEERRYEEALIQAQKDLENARGEELDKLNDQITKLKQQLDTAHEAKERAISRAQMTKSGYIYVISNIGSFGENIYKIGMTRRLEPMDRVKELGDASVPFQFDVHAMIFSENAPELENKLHNTFNDRRVNLINNRKEYFHVKLEKIEQVVNEVHGAEIEFTKLAEAEEYRETLALLKQLTKDMEKEGKKAADVEYPERLFE